MLIFVALEPRLYGEALGDALRDRRPDLEVKVVDPNALGSEMAHSAPDLVLCDQPRPDGSPDVLAWIKYRPYAGPKATLHVRDQRFDVDLAGLVDLLSVVDKAEDLL